MLKWLGIEISETTVAKYMIERRGPPPQAWRTFLANHAKETIALDFFTVPTPTFKVLFVLIVLSHDRRRILHCNVTEHPTAVWKGRQLLQACGPDEAPRYPIRDRDAIYGAAFQRQARAIGIEEVSTAPRSPWQISLSKDSPDARAIQPPGQGIVREIEHVGGLHHEYVRAAA